MQKKKDKKIIIIVILMIILVYMIYMYYTNEESEQTNLKSISPTTEEKITESTAEIRTITNTISSSEKIETGLDETLVLHSTYYFEEIYFQQGDKVNEGEKILKYTNGTYMTAPYNLIIVSLNIPQTNQKCTNSHNIQVYAIDTLTINMNIEEDSLNKVSFGQEVIISPSIDTNKQYIGYITSINNSGTYSSKGTTYTAKVTFENDDTLKLGMSAKVAIILEKAENVVAIPKEAVQTKNNQKIVNIIENGETKQVSVETGIENDAYIEIKSGIEEGQTIQITKQENDTSTQTTNRKSIQMNRAEDREIPQIDSTTPIEK